MTEATRQRLLADMHRVVAEGTPAIVKNSVSAVRREHQSNPKYLRR